MNDGLMGVVGDGIQQVAFRVVCLFQVGIVADRLDPLL